MQRRAVLLTSASPRTTQTDWLPHHRQPRTPPGAPDIVVVRLFLFREFLGRAVRRQHLPARSTRREDRAQPESRADTVDPDTSKYSRCHSYWTKYVYPALSLIYQSTHHVVFQEVPDLSGTGLTASGENRARKHAHPARREAQRRTERAPRRSSQQARPDDGRMPAAVTMAVHVPPPPPKGEPPPPPRAPRLLLRVRPPPLIQLWPP